MIDTLMYWAGWLMFMTAGACLAVLASLRHTLPGLQQVGFMGLGLNAVFAGIVLQTEYPPCTPWQFVIRIFVFGISVLLITGSLLRRHAPRSHHAHHHA